MHVLSIVRLAIKYPFRPPMTFLKLGMILLGLVAGALAFLGLLTIIAINIVTLLWITGGWRDSEWEIEARHEQWISIQYRFGDPVSPQWMPDGSSIYIGGDIYFGGEGGGRELSTYVVGSDGSELKELEHVVWPHVSPDGSRMVYSTWRDTGEKSYDIETAKPDGSDRRRLTEDSTYIDIAPSWSPDGSRIAFARVTFNSCCDTGIDERGIYIMAADGSGLRRVYRLRGSLPEDPADEEFQSGPVWSPDGETLAFSIYQRMTVGAEGKREVREVVYTIGADGLNLAAMYDTETQGRGMGSPAWSPDGGRLAFESEFSYIVNSDGTGLRKAADVERVRSVSWSPDGTRLLLIGYADNHGGFSVYVAEADGGGHRRLGDRFRQDRAAAWSPDGSRIAIVEIYVQGPLASPYRRTKPYLQTMAPDGSDVQVLVERQGGELKAANPAERWKWPWQH